MSMATLLKGAANVLMGLTLVRLLAGDVGAEIRQDAARLGEKTQAVLRRSPYRAAGSAAALALVVGFLLGQRRHRAAR